MEFEIEVECPHCDCEQTCLVEFNDNEFDKFGGQSYVMKQKCMDEDCEKDFWFDVSLRFDLDVDNVYSKKPKDAK